jgi:hypothetical protein
MQVLVLASLLPAQELLELQQLHGRLVVFEQEQQLQVQELQLARPQE